jgi:hypothetical protein
MSKTVKMSAKTAGRIIVSLGLGTAVIGYFGDWGAILLAAVVIFILEWIT